MMVRIHISYLVGRIIRIPRHCLLHIRLLLLAEFVENYWLVACILPDAAQYSRVLGLNLLLPALIASHMRNGVVVRIVRSSLARALINISSLLSVCSVGIFPVIVTHLFHL